MAQISAYYDLQTIAKTVSQGKHRGLVGDAALWGEIGQLQFDYLAADGLTPEMRLIDIGCGCLRGGVHFVGYLDPGNYYGIDMSQALLDAGYEIELAQLGLQSRLPRQNLKCVDNFDTTGFSQSFDVALAQSVFSHLTVSHMRFCLAQLADTMRPGGRFYATIFLAPEGADWRKPATQSPGGIVTHPDRNPYHFQASDLDYCCSALPWRLTRLEGWNHPRNQIMTVFERLPDPAA